MGVGWSYTLFTLVSKYEGCKQSMKIREQQDGRTKDGGTKGRLRGLGPWGGGEEGSRGFRLWERRTVSPGCL